MDQGAYLDAVDVDIPLLLFDDVPLTGADVADVLHVHQHSAEQLIQLGRIRRGGA